MKRMTELLNIKLTNKNFHSKNGTVEVLSSINFSIEEGEFISIVGQSGCGKSTLLRIIAGLEKEFEGSVSLNRNNNSISFIFQDLGLFPWMTVTQNLQFTNASKTEIEVALKNVSLYDYKDSWLKELSGGMKQRLAVARGLININKPKILLMDEPLRELDMITKEKLQSEIKQLLKKSNATTILVTHDIEEAIYFSNRVIVLSEKPAVVKKIFSVNLNTDDRYSPVFQNLKAEIKNELI
jgi:sulfonate transport system ATP-binding protein